MKLNGGEAVVECLRREGVRVAFGVVGSSILEILDLLPRAGITYVGARHEQWAAHMADAYTRVRRAPSVCLAQNGPGVTNLVTGFATAALAGSPVIGLAGAVESSQIGRSTYQEIDHLGVMRPVCKWVGRANRPERIPEVVRWAFREAWSPPLGPAFVDFPRDFIYEMIDAEFPPPDAYRGQWIGGVDAGLLGRIADLIRGCQRPVIIAGGGVVWSRASAAVESLAEKIFAPMVTTYGHNDAVRNDHPLFIGSLGRGGSQAAMQVTADADLILAVGTRLDSFTFLPYYGFSYSPVKAHIVQVDVDPSQIGRFSPVTLGLICDGLVFVRELIQMLSSNIPPREDWLQTCLLRKQRWEEMLRSSVDWQARPVQLEAAYAVAQEVLGGGAIVTLDVGSTPSLAYSRLAYSQPTTLLSPLRAGGVGFALPAAIGAKLAEPEEHVVAILGDGAFTMELSNLITAVEYGVATVALVFDNSAWGAEKANQQHYYDSHYVGSILANPSLVEVAESLGADAYLASSVEELRLALQAALKSSKPSVIVVPVDRERFPLPARRDVLRRPVRGLYV